MGYMCHHAIVLTSWKEEAIDEARHAALMLFPHRLVSPVLDSVANGYKTFLIAPDGSKEGWEPSNLGDCNRFAFVEWLRGNHVGCIKWVEVQYGDDSLVTKVVADSDEWAREEEILKFMRQVDPMKGRL